MSNIFKSRIVSVEDEKYSMGGRESAAAALRPAMPAVTLPMGVSLSETAEKARRMVEDARREARDILAEARMKAESMKKAAYQRGKDQAREDYNRLIGEANGVLEDMCAQREALLDRYEDDILNLSLHIARKIIGETIEYDRAMLTRIYKQAVERIKAENEQIRVRLSLESMDVIIPDELGADVTPDRTLSRDECIVETENGEVNISIHSQLEQVSAEFSRMTVQP